MSRFQEFCDAVINSNWNQDLRPDQKGKLALALLDQKELFQDIMADNLARFAFHLAKELDKEQQPF